MTPQELKNSILQLAIQGKLVEQRPEEGTAEELYKKIQKEKQKQINEGKIKKEKPLPEITEDEVPFEIPESWKWVRLGDCSSYAQTKEKVTSSNIKPNTWSLDLEDIEKDTGKIENYCLAKNRRITGDKVVFHKGQVLYSKLRPYLKKILVAPEDGICTPELVPFNTYGHIDNQYLVYFLKSPHVDFIINSVTYGIKMPRVGTETMVNLLLPLPPLAEQKRIVAKIEELLPLADRYGEAWDRLEELNKRFPDDMRKSVLQLAIQGKLVEQRPEEGTAEELYKKIQAEKQKLIKEGKIKKEKPLPEITEEEIPFDIPEGWKWVRLGGIASLVTKGTTPRGGNVSYKESGIGFLRAENVAGYDRIDKSTLKYVDPNTHIGFLKRSIIEENDILITIAGTLGRTAMVRKEDLPLNANQAVSIVRIVNTEEINLLYLIYTLNAGEIQKYLIDQRKITAVPNLTLEIIDNCIIPLPPLAEQRRIVAKIEGLLPLCEGIKNEALHIV